ncbi:uncharacterized protein METZ01_LOCUS409123, partial [marine metagenome]
MSRVIAIVNQKGGVGKTTTAINLGAALAVADRRTLLVDMDPQCNATSGLGLDPQEGNATIYDVLVRSQDAREAVTEAIQFELLDLIPSTRGLAGAEIEMVEVPARETLLRRSLDPIREHYDY